MAKALALALMIMVSACQTTGGNFCQIERPEYLTASQIDALPADTARRILDRNEKGERLCKWKESK